MKITSSVTFYHVSKSFDVYRKPSIKSQLSNFSNPKPDPVTVIHDVSFNVTRGEIVGLYGANGSGKSTILRLIANILTPDSGRITTQGKIAPVIELGSGLHPELTGRENILLYASILGMSTQYVRTHIEKIISYSELTQYIDTPIKKYSSGMKARLAFSVAIFSDAQIMLFDEVFAVGDTSFKDKSIRLLRKIKKTKAVLLTSHDISLMQQVCDRILILDQGRLINEQNETLIKFIQQMPKDHTFIAEATSNSMYPLIKSGEYITGKTILFNKIRPDDIILFHLKNLPQIIVHRVVDIIMKNNEKICITRGDSVFGLDAWEIGKNNYLGKVIRINNKHIR